MNSGAGLVDYNRIGKQYAVRYVIRQINQPFPDFRVLILLFTRLYHAPQTTVRL